MDLNSELKWVNQVPVENLPQLHETVKASIDKLENYKLNLSKWMTLMVLIYFLFSARVLSSLSFAGMSLEFNLYFDIVIPALISASILCYIVVAIRQGEAKIFYNLIFERLFHNQNADYDTGSRIVIICHPISIQNIIIQSENVGKKLGCLSSLVLSTPLAIIQLMPYAFIFYGLYNIWMNHIDLGIAQLCFWLAIYFNIIGIWMFCRYIYLNTKKKIEYENLYKRVD